MSKRRIHVRHVDFAPIPADLWWHFCRHYLMLKRAGMSAEEARREIHCDLEVIAWRIEHPPVVEKRKGVRRAK